MIKFFKALFADKSDSVLMVGCGNSSNYLILNNKSRTIRRNVQWWLSNDHEHGYK